MNVLTKHVDFHIYVKRVHLLVHFLIAKYLIVTMILK